MLLTVVSLELLLLALVVWAGFIRANSYFTIPALRWLFTLPAWCVFAGLIYVVETRREMVGYLEQLKPLKEIVDILASNRQSIAVYCVIGLSVLMMAVLVLGLSPRASGDGTAVPRARRWRWSVLVGGSGLLVATMWGSTELAEHRLKSRTDAVAEEARILQESATVVVDPIAEADNAAILYRRAAEMPSPVVPQHERWDTDRRPGWNGEETLPLTPEEERVATVLVAAGRLRHCSFDQVEDSDYGNPGIQRYREFTSLLQRRIITSDDPKIICESLAAIRDLSTHLCCDPVIRDVWAYSEEKYLDCVADIAVHCPERLVALDRKELMRDDADAILAGIETDAIRIEAWNAQTMARLLEPPTGWDESAFSSYVRLTKATPFDEAAVGLRRFAIRLRRVVEGNQMLDLYRDRIGRFRSIVSSAKSIGHADWPAWRDFESVERSRATWDDHADAALQAMLRDAYLRYSFISVRRVANAGLAATIFRQEKGRLPATLDELVPEYLTKVPIDLSTGKPIGWKTTNDAIYIYAADRPDGESKGLEYIEGPDATLNHANWAVRIPARLPAGKPSAKLPTPQP